MASKSLETEETAIGQFFENLKVFLVSPYPYLINLQNLSKIKTGGIDASLEGIVVRDILKIIP